MPVPAKYFMLCLCYVFFSSSLTKFPGLASCASRTAMTYFPAQSTLKFAAQLLLAATLHSRQRRSGRFWNSQSSMSSLLTGRSAAAAAPSVAAAVAAAHIRTKEGNFFFKC